MACSTCGLSLKAFTFQLVARIYVYYVNIIYVYICIYNCKNIYVLYVCTHAYTQIYMTTDVTFALRPLYNEVILGLNLMCCFLCESLRFSSFFIC